MTRGPGQDAQTAHGIQGDGAAGSVEDLERSEAVINHHIEGGPHTGDTAVDFNRQVGGLGIKTRQADKCHGLGLGFQGRELACCG